MLAWALVLLRLVLHWHWVSASVLLVPSASPWLLDLLLWLRLLRLLLCKEGLPWMSLLVLHGVKAKCCRLQVSNRRVRVLLVLGLLLGLPRALVPKKHLMRSAPSNQCLRRASRRRAAAAPSNQCLRHTSRCYRDRANRRCRAAACTRQSLMLERLRRRGVESYAGSRSYACATFHQHCD